MIDKDMPLEDIIRDYPETLDILKKYKIGCIGCKAALFGNVQQGADAHGIKVETLLASLNDSIKRR